MAVYREAPICEKCGERIKGVYKDQSDIPSLMRVIGDTFLRWDFEGHKCKEVDKTQTPIPADMKKMEIKIFKIIVGKFRLFWGFCPACNSDAPQKYDCSICENYSSSFDGGHPPKKELKKLWWKRYLKQFKKDLYAK